MNKIEFDADLDLMFGLRILYIISALKGKNIIEIDEILPIVKKVNTPKAFYDSKELKDFLLSMGVDEDLYNYGKELYKQGTILNTLERIPIEKEEEKVLFLWIIQLLGPREVIRITLCDGCDGIYQKLLCMQKSLINKYKKNMSTTLKKDIIMTLQIEDLSIKSTVLIIAYLLEGYCFENNLTCLFEVMKEDGEASSRHAIYSQREDYAGLDGQGGEE